MTQLILRRLGSAVLTIVLASLLVFLAIQALPGDVAQQILGRDATEESIAKMRSELGLDTPVVLRYIQWLFGAVQGDFGTSLVSGEPVGPTLLLHFRNTLLIAIPTVLIAVTLSILLGVVAGLRRNRWQDHRVAIVSGGGAGWSRRDRGRTVAQHLAAGHSAVPSDGRLRHPHDAYLHHRRHDLGLHHHRPA